MVPGTMTFNLFFIFLVVSSIFMYLQVSKVLRCTCYCWQIQNFYSERQWQKSGKVLIFLWSLNVLETAITFRSVESVRACQSADICLFKVNNGSTNIINEIYSKLTTMTLERQRCRRSGVFVINFEQISLIVLVLPLLTFNK